ncbi:MAG: thermostable hemolysin [Gammaproteobacteria bacterium]|jgi:hypothetical protein|nr:thermostable hemolysin [Gammaproteobacteria bacterium]
MQASITTELAHPQPLAETPPLLRRLLRFNPEFNLHRPGSPERNEVEDYIAAVFAEAYGADVTGFAPFLMSMSCAGRISAAAGIRPAADSPLFLEQYLDAPVEDVLSARYGRAIPRSEIFELGNLAALRPGVCQLIYLIMAGVVARTDLNYAVFAGTRQVAKGVGRLGFCMEPIVAADPARLGTAADSWGTYYKNAPQVTVLDLRKSMTVLADMPLPRILLEIYAPQIELLAAHFNSVHRYHSNQHEQDS